MELGDVVREIVVEPLELPAPLQEPTPAPVEPPRPVETPREEPVLVPA